MEIIGIAFICFVVLSAALLLIIALFFSIFDELASLEADINKTSSQQREEKTEKISIILESLREDSPISCVYAELISENLGFLLSEGVNPDICVKHMRPEDISNKIETLLDAGATPSLIINRMYVDDIQDNAWRLMRAGVDPELIKRWL